MSAGDELALKQTHQAALRARAARDRAIERERETTLGFMREALRQRKNWKEIGDMLDVTSTGARRYYERACRRGT